MPLLAVQVFNGFVAEFLHFFQGAYGSACIVRRRSLPLVRGDGCRRLNVVELLLGDRSFIEESK
jgi:hypothetical protein